MQFSVGVNNVFNEVYSTVAYSGTYYYPMPGRNFYVELQLRV
jgi:outer membrane receptor protein involved in Fe transport